jgi:hypothetical protein
MRADIENDGKLILLIGTVPVRVLDFLGKEEKPCS